MTLPGVKIQTWCHPIIMHAFLCSAAVVMNTVDYIQNHYRNFSIIHFFRHFKYCNRQQAEKSFKSAVGVLVNLKRDTSIQDWAKTIQKDNFSVSEAFKLETHNQITQILSTVDVNTYWRELTLTEARRDSETVEKLAIYHHRRELLHEIDNVKESEVWWYYFLPYVSLMLVYEAGSRNFIT